MYSRIRLNGPHRDAYALVLLSACLINRIEVHIMIYMAPNKRLVGLTGDPVIRLF